MAKIFDYLKTPDSNLIIGWFILISFLIIQNYGINYWISIYGYEEIRKVIEDYGLTFYFELYKYAYTVVVAYLFLLPIYLILKLIFRKAKSI